ncbi:glutathione S-transferase family protein [Falsirhodobacter algicola]|uniref:Glutathione S-transferase n=1 Tax=Falsirhodobacter algicola TaxID=2692330 RepID=A0A8J8MSL2_9RHOB|nr:glutathione S-transferase family protein [Falsirhodobacter algicola]QUS35707.1 hypothetical protein GR316_05145 [Falsirhodobacter algicola]
MELYHGSATVCSQKVRLAFAELNVPYTSKLLDLGKGDQFRPDYLALNPEAVVPTLVDGDLIVVESSLIIEYLDREKGGRALSPSDPAAEVAASHWLLRTLGVHSAINALSFATAARDKMRATQTAEEIEHHISQMPDLLEQEKRRSLIQGGLASPHVTHALQTLRRTFADMQKALLTGEWLLGAEFSKADVAIVAYIDRLERLGFERLWTAEYPKVGTWLQAMRARPSYDVAVTAFTDPAAAEGMRQGGSRHWPELQKIWAGIA